MTEPDQELSMINVSTGMWLLGIDLLNDDVVTKNAMGMIHITGNEDLYHMEEVDNVEEDKAVEVKAVEVMEKVDGLAKELGVDTDKFLEVVKKLGDLVEDE